MLFPAFLSVDSAAYYDRADDCAGAFYGGSGAAVGANVVFILAVIGWVGFTSAMLFLGIKFTIGIRVPEADEVRWMHTPCNCFLL